MTEIDPKYTDEQLRSLCERYLRKSAVMREICDGRHDKSLRRAAIRDFVTVAASTLFLALNFFGTTQIASTLGIGESTATIFMSIATFLLLASSIWQISSDRTSPFQNYRGIQAFASLSNKIEYVTSGARLDEVTATYWAKKIISSYENAARDIPRISDSEHAAAKKRLK